MGEVEIWKDIPGYEGIYQVSVLGRVKSLARKGSKGGILKFSRNKDGYLYVSFYKNSMQSTFKVHRLVCGAFYVKPHDKNYVDHRDGNKTNNNASNLRWCTFKENIRFAWDLGIYSVEKSSNAILTEKEARSIKDMLSSGIKAKDIFPLFKIKINAVYDIKQGRCWKDA